MCRICVFSRSSTAHISLSHTQQTIVFLSLHSRSFSITSQNCCAQGKLCIMLLCIYSAQHSILKHNQLDIKYYCNLRTCHRHFSVNYKKYKRNFSLHSFVMQCVENLYSYKILLFVENIIEKINKINLEREEGRNEPHKFLMKFTKVI